MVKVIAILTITWFDCEPWNASDIVWKIANDSNANDLHGLIKVYTIETDNNKKIIRLKEKCEKDRTKKTLTSWIIAVWVKRIVKSSKAVSWHVWLVPGANVDNVLTSLNLLILQRDNFISIF